MQYLFIFSPMCSPTSPSNFEHQQKHHQQQQPSGGFIQPQNPWRGQTNSTQPLGAGINQASNFGTNCDQHQVFKIRSRIIDGITMS